MQISGKKVFQAEGMPNTKALRHVQTWNWSPDKKDKDKMS